MWRLPSVVTGPNGTISLSAMVPFGQHDDMKSATTPGPAALAAATLPKLAIGLPGREPALCHGQPSFFFRETKRPWASRARGARLAERRTGAGFAEFPIRVTRAWRRPGISGISPA